jgi:non-ribosomal peptide synthetase component F
MKARDGSDSEYGPGKSIIQFASQVFAASVVEIFKTLGNDGCIRIPSEKVRLNNITEFMKEHKITRVFFPPTLLKLFKPEMFPTLEKLLTGGEPVLPALIEM